MQKRFKPWLINGIVFVLMVSAVAMFDLTLTLGDLHGIVFKLYTFYGSILLIFINLLVAGYLFAKDKKQSALMSVASAMTFGFAGIALVMLTPG